MQYFSDVLKKLLDNFERFHLFKTWEVEFLGPDDISGFKI